MNTLVSRPRLAAFGAGLLLLTTSLLATDYGWTTTGTSGHDWSGANAKWTPSGNPSTASDNAAFSSLTASTAVNLNGSFAVNDLAAASNGGTTLTLIAAGAARTFSIAGQLTKSANSNTVLFRSDGTATLDLTINALTLSTGTYRFGNPTAAAGLNNLSVGAVTLNTSSGNAMIDLNVAHDYALGLVTFAGAGSSSRTVNLISSTEAGYSRTVTVDGLSQSQGPAGVINASKTAGSSGTHQATLVLATAVATSRSATTVLADGTGGVLALRKTGAGTQSLSGANTFTGGTSVEGGTLIVSGSLASSGDLAVSAGATFVAASALTVADVSLASGAVLGFDLGAPASSLTIAGDLLKTGAGATAFTVDFRNTGLFDHSYAGLLSITGSALNDFAGASLSYVNFGADGQSGVLSFAQLTGGFSVSAVPEPATCALLGGLAALALVVFHRRRAA